MHNTTSRVNGSYYPFWKSIFLFKQLIICRVFKGSMRVFDLTELQEHCKTIPATSWPGSAVWPPWPRYLAVHGCSAQMRLPSCLFQVVPSCQMQRPRSCLAYNLAKQHVDCERIFRMPSHGYIARSWKDTDKRHAQYHKAIIVWIILYLRLQQFQGEGSAWSEYAQVVYETP